MADPSWKLVAQTDAKAELNDTYQLFIYQYTGSSPVSKTVRLLSDFRLRRGSGSSKSKRIGITATQVDFSIIDGGGTLSGLLGTEEEKNVKGIIKKNGAVFFIGLVSGFLNKYDYTKNDIILKLTIYDGLSRLEEEKNITALPAGLSRLSEILRYIFNSLSFELNIYSYIETNTSVARPLYLMYADVKDIVAARGGIETSYHDILNILCRSFLLEIFQMNGKWIIRQITGVKNVTNVLVDGIREEIISYADGTSTESKVSLNRAISSANLQFNPRKFFIRKIDRVVYKLPYALTGLASYYRRRKELDWENGYFKDGSSGWSVESGSAEFKDNSLYVTPGSVVSQESGDLDRGQKIKIKISALCIRMILSDADVLYHYFPEFGGSRQYENPMFRIAVQLNQSVTHYYLKHTDLTWEGPDTVPDPHNASNDSLWGADMWGTKIYYNNNNDFEYYKEYCPVVISKDIEVFLPTAGIAGSTYSVIIYLYGGASSNYPGDYPLEVPSQYNHVVVEKAPDEEPSFTAPGHLRIVSEIANAKNEEVLPATIHDVDPFLPVSLWTWTPGDVIAQTTKWMPGGLPLLEHLCRDYLNFNHDREAFDINLLPGAAMSYNDIINCNLDGSGTTYFIPQYEETLLLADKKRFIIFRHRKQSLTLTHKKEYVF